LSAEFIEAETGEVTGVTMTFLGRQQRGKKKISRRGRSAKAGNFAARAAPGLDIRREIVYFSYFT